MNRNAICSEMLSQKTVCQSKIQAISYRNCSLNFQWQQKTLKFKGINYFGWVDDLRWVNAERLTEEQAALETVPNSWGRWEIQDDPKPTSRSNK